MSLFSSPGFRVLNSENSESQIQRKPGANTLLPRKPFVDKTVNCNTPDVNRKQKSSLSINESVTAPSPTMKTPNLEIDPEWLCSCKEVDNYYEDIFPQFKRLEYHDVYNILKNYVNDSTPPPSPISLKMPFAVPLTIDSLESSFISDKSYDEDMFCALPVDEIDLPVFNMELEEQLHVPDLYFKFD